MTTQIYPVTPFLMRSPQPSPAWCLIRATAMRLLADLVPDCYAGSRSADAVPAFSGAQQLDVQFPDFHRLCQQQPGQKLI